MAKIDIGSGWLIIANNNTPTNWMEVYFENARVSFIFESKISHYAGGLHFGYHLGKEWLELLIENIIITSHAKLTLFLDTIKDWQNASSMYIRIAYNSTPNYVEWDGDNTFFEVLIKDRIQGIHQASSSKETFIIERITFEQIG